VVAFAGMRTVVTMPALEAWLTAEILPTWQFTD
jgi:hypothetical protein